MGLNNLIFHLYRIQFYRDFNFVEDKNSVSYKKKKNID